jgi:hypothetical protein
MKTAKKWHLRDEVGLKGMRLSKVQWDQEDTRQENYKEILRKKAK